MSKGEDVIIAGCSRIASSLSIITLIGSAILYSMIIQDLESFSGGYNVLLKDVKNIQEETSSELLASDRSRVVRQSFYPQRNTFNYRSGPNEDGFSQSRWQHRQSPKICDCTVMQCPRGPRGPPGEPGEVAEDGIPGEAGRPGVDGLYQVEEEKCPPCPRGPRGADGPPGEKGASGKPGIPGIPGRDGTNEPGPAGEPGNRGQTGRTGKKGISGEPGQDAVQLIGAPGLKGPDGLPGFPGPRGDPGENGIPAAPGPEGSPGPEGEPGDPGEFGPRGPPGRKGPPGIDGGYCQCPPREGSGIASSSGTDSLPLTWEEYRSGSVRTAAIPESRHIPRNQGRQQPRYEQEESEDTDRYPQYPKNNGRFIEVADRKMSHSPMAPMIEYRDSREQGVRNHVILSRHPTTSKGSADFEFRKL